ncbi:hypothetical protein B0H13DRAFT_1857569 [Mycena leptocephala]|nr:hypothetical protein B0H13DRAFT_1857569 [Mycena leptocephala]
MYSKRKVGLNHLKANVLEGLQDVPTLTELVVLALYANSVSYAYMRVACATGDRKMNTLDLGTFHAEVIRFCEAVAENTDLLAPDASYETGTLNGQPWEHPDVFYAIQRMAPMLPNLAGCLKAFMTGAVDIWKRFGEEYHEDGIIAQLSPSARDLIYINPTNGHNEGALGRPRRAVRDAAHLALSAHNAKSKYTINDTHEFLRSATVTEAFRKLKNVVVEENKAAEAKRKARAAEILAELKSLKPPPGRGRDHSKPQEDNSRLSRTSTGIASVSGNENEEGIPIVESWDAEDELLEEDMLDDSD